MSTRMYLLQLILPLMPPIANAYRCHDGNFNNGLELVSMYDKKLGEWTAQQEYISCRNMPGESGGHFREPHGGYIKTISNSTSTTKPNIKPTLGVNESKVTTTTPRNIVKMSRRKHTTRKPLPSSTTNRPTTSQDTPKGTQDTPKGIKDTAKGIKDTPVEEKGTQDTPKGIKDTAKGIKDTPVEEKGIQDTPVEKEWNKTNSMQDYPTLTEYYPLNDSIVIVGHNQTLTLGPMKGDLVEDEYTDYEMEEIEGRSAEETLNKPAPHK